MVGLGGLEPPTSPLSGARSNHLSYRPDALREKSAHGCAVLLHVPRREPRRNTGRCLVWEPWVDKSRSRKEVIQPHLPIRLPCYDFTPVIDHSVVSVPLAVRLPTSGATNSHGVTGGVYKARERIHRDNADSRLLAIPTSRSRVADFDPD